MLGVSAGAVVPPIGDDAKDAIKEELDADAGISGAVSSCYFSDSPFFYIMNKILLTSPTFLYIK